MNQFDNCDSSECGDTGPGPGEEDDSGSFASSSLGLLTILFSSFLLLVLLDYSCEKRFLCLRRFCGYERQRPDHGGKSSNPQSFTSSENHSPIGSDDENAHTVRIANLRNKRRDIENWVEHKKVTSPVAKKKQSRQQRPSQRTPQRTPHRGRGTPAGKPLQKQESLVEL